VDIRGDRAVLLGELEKLLVHGTTRSGPCPSQTNPNTMSYTITFCPDGLDGLGSS